jgi:hypothetical protein
MPKVVVLVSCVSKKADEATQARNLYISTWFKKASEYARKFGDQWFILSAKYGLVDPRMVIEPYDQTLKDMKVCERRAWAKGVISDLLPRLGDSDTIVFLASKLYREFLIGPLSKSGMNIEIPMEGLSIGKQLQWLNRHLQGLRPS